MIFPQSGSPPVFLAPMKQIEIVFYSGTGHTRLLAEAIQEGANSLEGVQARLLPIEGSHIHEGRYRNESAFQRLGQADALVFGTPTYMGGVAAQLKAFFDATSGIWMKQGWKDKLAGGFTTSGSPSGDKLATLQQIGILAAQHAMTWVNAAGLPTPDGSNRLGSSLGVMAHTPFSDGPAQLHPGDAETARSYGRRVAERLLSYSLAPVAA